MREGHAPRMDPAETLIRQEIELGGPLRFDRFVDVALYHPVHGYYNRGGARRGRGGDYFTSMQVSDLFPRIFAEVVKSMREAMGADQFCLIELGSGGGEFLEGVLKALTDRERKGLRVWAVERSRPAREHLWRRLSRFGKCEAVASIDDIEWMGALEGCVFSNEFFDALPFRRLRRSASGWNEIFIGLVEGALKDIELPLADPAVLIAGGLDGLDVEPGVEVEVRPDVPDVVENIAARLTRGWIATVDYGHPASAIGRSPRGTWRCFHEHALNEEPCARIGRQDITASVDFSQLARAGHTFDFDTQLFASQGVFLAHAGQSVIERTLALRQDPAPIRAIQQLLHPDAMGERFSVLVQGRSVGLPPVLAAVPSRAARLGARTDQNLNLR